MTLRLPRALLASLALLPGAAFAHSGAEASGFVHGFAHPFGGLDHLLAMLAVGVVASRFEGAKRWLLPLAFVAFMTLGGVLGALSVSLPFVEAAIALSLVTLGVAIFLSKALPYVPAAAVVGAFALFHGHAHGTEMLGASLLAYSAGFMLATALLHAGGLCLTLRATQYGQRALAAVRIGGGLIAAAGVALLSFA